jgi:hypothetical protein
MDYKMKQYKWKDYARSPVKVSIVGRELEQLIEDNGGKLTPATVVESAKRAKSPIHNCFEWDDTAAAKKYREDQARYLLHSVVVVYDADTDEPITTRLTVNIQTEEESYYTTTVRAMAQTETADYVENIALRDLLALKKKYEHLQRFRQVWQTIEQL